MQDAAPGSLDEARTLLGILGIGNVLDSKGDQDGALGHYSRALTRRIKQAKARGSLDEANALLGTGNVTKL
jgi:hypothetical protein